jgi:hypothetical protein
MSFGLTSAPAYFMNLMNKGLHRKLTMAQDSDVILDFVGTLVWFVVLMLSLLIVAL